MIRKASWLMATLAIACTMPAQAAQYTFSFTTSTPLFGPLASGSGVFTTSGPAMMVGGQTAYTITSITGMVNGSAINEAMGSYGNYFTTGPTFLDGTGVTFGTAAGNTIVFFNQSSNGLYRVNTFSPGSTNFVEATSSLVAAAVPEPASWALMIGGFAFVGSALRTRRTKLATLTA